MVLTARHHLKETAYLLARVTGAAPPRIARSGDVQSAAGGHAGQLDPRLDSQSRNCGEGGRLRYAVIRTGIWRSPVVLPSRDSRCWTTASQSRRTGLCGRAVPWRPWRSSARAAAGILACPASRIRSCRKASRSPDSARMPASTSFADRHYQLWNGQPAGSGEPVTGNRRRGPWVATRSAEPAFRASRAASVLSRRGAPRRRGPAGPGHDDALFHEAMGELDEQERVAVSLLDCALRCADFNVLT